MFMIQSQSVNLIAFFELLNYQQVADEWHMVWNWQVPLIRILKEELVSSFGEKTKESNVFSKFFWTLAEMKFYEDNKK